MSDFKFEGMKELEQNIKRLAEMTSKGRAKGQIKQGIRTAAKPMLAKSKQFAAEDTGELESSLKLRNSIKGVKSNGRDLILAFIHSSAPQASWIEFGTGPRSNKDGANRGKIEPDPFMRPAVEEHASEFSKLLAPSVSDQIKKAIGKVK